ncbi:hypothetical protein [Streptomyces sp. G45]|uniref:hypothetical protein n=1 Tax=Streptomyces sp. G45 TaxID=3406627 RepID=UPI003C180F71
MSDLQQHHLSSLLGMVAQLTEQARSTVDQDHGPGRGDDRSDGWGDDWGQGWGEGWGEGQGAALGAGPGAAPGAGSDREAARIFLAVYAGVLIETGAGIRWLLEPSLIEHATDVIRAREPAVGPARADLAARLLATLWSSCVLTGLDAEDWDREAPELPEVCVRMAGLLTGEREPEPPCEPEPEPEPATEPERGPERSRRFRRTNRRMNRRTDPE